MTTEQTWEISDIDGRNKRTVTIAQYRAELDARKPFTAAIMAAIQRGDIKAASAAQEAMRARFAS
jgi:hypothetical protein